MPGDTLLKGSVLLCTEICCTHILEGGDLQGLEDWKAIIQIVFSRRMNIMPSPGSNTVAKEEGETEPFTVITKKYIPNKTE